MRRHALRRGRPCGAVLRARCVTHDAAMNSSPWRGGVDESRARAEAAAGALQLGAADGRRLSDAELARLIKANVQRPRSAKTQDYRHAVRSVAVLFSMIEKHIAEGDEVGPRCYSHAIAICARMKAMRFAERLWADMHARGVKPTSGTYCAMIAAFASKARADDAVFLWRQMEEQGIEPSRMHYGAMINAQARAGRETEMFSWFERMVEAGVVPTIATFVALLSGCEHPETAYDILRSMRARYGVLPSPMAFNAALGVCARSDLPVEERCRAADRIVAEMDRRNCPRSTETFNVLLSIRGRVSNEAALSVMEDMAGASIRPDAVTYATFIRVCSNFVEAPPMSTVAERNAALSYENARAEGNASTPHIHTNLMHCYAKSGNAEAARRLHAEQVAMGIKVSEVCSAYLREAIEKEKEVRIRGTAERRLAQHDHTPRPPRYLREYGGDSLWESHRDYDSTMDRLCGGNRDVARSTDRMDAHGGSRVEMGVWVQPATPAAEWALPEWVDRPPSRVRSPTRRYLTRKRRFKDLVDVPTWEKGAHHSRVLDGVFE
eukprot:TRINITY_DN13822_c0_g1_i2.p1 TRINITY_DN13822_c0_g1~~TRINITY_DN13822_c0_g1_i2.p1  ORF type:complete len:550 (+),score=169.08 TRINITY_DN13822_c0_g1_i2:67-1716(+)